MLFSGQRLQLLPNSTVSGMQFSLEGTMPGRVSKIVIATFLTGSLLTTAAAAFVGQEVHATRTAASATPAPIERIGCYRLGLSGYHWYHFCAGPGFLYPHHRVCGHHSCYYR
jgi:hypothetical protein